jgi:4'-phosphopantetheinyl transferase
MRSYLPAGRIELSPDLPWPYHLIGCKPVKRSFIPSLSGWRASPRHFPAPHLRMQACRSRIATAPIDSVSPMISEHRGASPQPLELAVTEHGRPFLADDTALAFSISHAGTLVAVALALDARVGLDVESLDRRLQLDPLAERIFNPTDLARFRTLPPASRHAAFFRAWTGKEAILKAQGIGLFGGVQEISVPMEEKSNSTTVPGPDKSTWHLVPLTLPAGYLGAVACDDSLQNVLMHDYAF